ncbi:hypothetical protein CRI94_16435 [Longibacter salinarum]|uniref:Uncharacterized protein n=1 Tax=Longibacter salinarum TaxID=1850348 RepID=A0A2A8CTW5_9BACT|nr:hypothetical protein [Longibacter salinarum]PEN11177.1 hypothetical protein CRI94_16435 [Longibacter salinarum]
MKRLPYLRSDLGEAQKLYSYVKSQDLDLEKGREKRLLRRYEKREETLISEIDRLETKGRDRLDDLTERIESCQEQIDALATEEEEIEHLWNEELIPKDEYRTEKRRIRLERRNAKNDIRSAKQERATLKDQLTSIRARPADGSVQTRLQELTGQTGKAVSPYFRRVISNSADWVSRFTPSQLTQLGRPDIFGTPSATSPPSTRYLWYGVAVLVLTILLNTVLGSYLADSVDEAMTRKAYQWQRDNRALSLNWGDVSVSPLFQTVSVADILVDVDERQNSSLQLRSATLDLSPTMAWDVLMDNPIEEVHSIGFAAAGLRVGNEDIQMNATEATIEFDGRVRTRTIRSGDLDQLLRHPQRITVEISDLDAGGAAIEKLDDVRQETLQGVSDASSIEFTASVDPEQRVLRISDLVVEDPDSYLDVSTNIYYSGQTAGPPEPTRMEVTGEWSTTDVRSALSEDATYQADEVEVWTDTPITYAFGSSSPLPEGRLIARLENGRITGRLPYVVKRRLDDSGLEPSVLREGVHAYLDYEHKNQVITLRESSLETGVGTFKADGHIRVSGDDASFRDLELQMDDVSFRTMSSVTDAMRVWTGTSVSASGSKLTVRLNGPFVRPRVQVVD